MNYIGMMLSGPMVIAEKEGRKTETRRTRGLNIINENPDQYEFLGLRIRNSDGSLVALFDSDNPELLSIKCPYGKPGDIIWVRETFRPIAQDVGDPRYEYKADELVNVKEKWKPAIHMPKKACRTFLLIDGISIERLNRISQASAIAEGIESWVEERMKSRPVHYKIYFDDSDEPALYSSCPVTSFETLWQSLHGKDSWKHNPWVWVIKFKRCHKPENF